MTTMKDWEKKVLSAPGAAERVEGIEEELRLAAGLTALRERSGLSQRELAERIGVRQPRIAAIERSRNVTFDVLERYVSALGGEARAVGDPERQEDCPAERATRPILSEREGN